MVSTDSQEILWNWGHAEVVVGDIQTVVTFTHEPGRSSLSPVAGTPTFLYRDGSCHRIENKESL